MFLKTLGVCVWKCIMYQSRCLPNYWREKLLFCSDLWGGGMVYCIRPCGVAWRGCNSTLATRCSSATGDRDLGNITAWAHLAILTPGELLFRPGKNNRKQEILCGELHISLGKMPQDYIGRQRHTHQAHLITHPDFSPFLHHTWNSVRAESQPLALLRQTRCLSRLDALTETCVWVTKITEVPVSDSLLHHLTLDLFPETCSPL